MTAIQQANKIIYGSTPAISIYAGVNKVWPFKPTDLSGCAVWMDASQITGYADGATLNSWTNLGSGGQPSIAWATNSPIYRKNALNGLPVVRLTQGQAQFRFAATGIDKDYTLAFVARRWSLRPGRVLAANTSAASTPNILWGFHGTEFESSHVESWMNTPGPVGGITATTDWKLYSGDSSSTAAARFFSNGVYLGSTAGIPAKGFASTLYLSGYDDTGLQTSDAEYAEVIMYNRKLTDAERAKVETYLRFKWLPSWLPFKPTDLSGCVIWLDASKLSVIQGTAVTAWPNLGSGPQPAFISYPSPSIQANALNGRQVVRFTGAQGRARFTGTGINKDYTIIFVARRWSTRAGRVMAAASSAANILFGFWSTRFDCAYIEGWLTPDDVVTDTLAWRQYSVDSTSTAVARLFKNGAVLRSGAATPVNGMGGTLNICGHDDISSEDADCDVAEVVMYNRKLSDGERASVEQYLRLKWAVA